MKQLFGFLALTAVLAGCSQADRDQLAAGGREALGKAFEASAGALQVAIASASKVDLNTPTAQLEAVREQASNALQKLRGIEIGPVKDQVERLRLEIDRIDKAIAEQKLKQQWDAALAKASQRKRLAEDRVAALRESLLKSSPEFKALDAQLEAARSAYRQASERVRALVPAN